MNIEVGQRLREIDPPHRTWEIVRIIRPPKGRSHAQLRLTANPKRTRMLSCTDLERGEVFLPVRDDQAA